MAVFILKMPGCAGLFGFAILEGMQYERCTSVLLYLRRLTFAELGSDAMNSWPIDALHMPTVYVSAGVMYLLVSAASWLMVKNQGGNAPTIWCVGGGVMGCGILLLGLRSFVPLWVTFVMGNSCVVLGNMLHVQALRNELGRPMWWLGMGAIFLVIMGPFQYMFGAKVDQSIRFMWTMQCLALLAIWTAWAGRQIALKEHNHSASWLAAGYALLGLLMSVRGILSWQGVLGVDVLTNSAESLSIVLGVLMAAIFGNVAVLGLYLERANQKNIAFAKEQERKNVLSTLGDRMADQYRRRSLEQMSSGLAHELGQPVTGILLDHNLVKRRLAKLAINDPDVEAYLDSLGKQALRARDVIESIRNFAKPGKTRFELLELQDVLNDVVRLKSYALREGRIRLEMRVCNQPLPVIGNRVLLSLVFLNAFRNAIQANDQSRPVKVRVSFHVQGMQLKVMIEDDGPGFSEQALNSVGKLTFTTKEDGMGIGLALCHRIAEQHNGHLLVHNQGELLGAVLELHLPLWSHSQENP